ncbi:hypothetical protein [Pectobacterium sp. A5351]|uniref:hypothetical protein n=1 Tax=Pectobacterium sp. A5351 TaxID=2914983 RepID=UPI00232D537F|nr:hypothetical protein [Pectobacterium sp. A5351]WCG81475.1 hypothetical protein O1Q74_10895 [Pectobacterium sp. A5351]
MTTLIFIGDVHNEDGCISQGAESLFKKTGFDIKKDKYVLLLEVVPDEDNDGLISKIEYDGELTVILEDKPNGKDKDILKQLMVDSDNNVYGFDNDKKTYGPERQLLQRKTIQNYVRKHKDTKNMPFYIIVVGAAHLEPNATVPGWIVLQDNSGNFYGENALIVENIPD